MVIHTILIFTFKFMACSQTSQLMMSSMNCAFRVLLQRRMRLQTLNASQKWLLNQFLDEVQLSQICQTNQMEV